MHRWIFGFLVLLSISCDSSQFKVATYNIYFLDDGIDTERRTRLRMVIQELNADVIGFQEINNPAALKNILPPSYEIVMLDDPDQVQETALAVRDPFRVKSYRYVFPDTADDDAFPRTRDLLEVTTEINNTEIIFLVHHFKSRSGGRMKTDPRREAAAAKIVAHVRDDLKGKHVVLLCDMNDNPDDRSANILEYGTNDAAAGIDSTDDTFFFNTTESLLEKDLCSYGYSYIFADSKPGQSRFTIPGAREENNHWRGKEHDFFKDVKIKALLMDQILVSMDLKSRFVEAGILQSINAVEGKSSSIKFTEEGIVYTKRGTLASDHVPVWAVFQF